MYTSNQESTRSIFYSDPSPEQIPLWKKATQIVLSVSATALSALGIAANQAKTSMGSVFVDRAVRTFSPFGLGCGLVGLSRSIIPNRAFMHWLRIESWRLGIPLYFLLTQLYLSVEGDNDAAKNQREAYLNIMMGMAGIQMGTFVDALFESKLKKTMELESLIMDGELIDEEFEGQTASIRERTPLPLREIPQKWRSFASILTAAVGATSFILPFVLPEKTLSPVVSDTMVAWGGYTITQITSSKIWEMTKKWEMKIEKQYHEASHSHSFSPDLPRSLQLFRIAEKVTVLITMPLSTLLFYRPFFPQVNYSGRIIAAGAFHGIYDEIYRMSFFSTPRKEIGELRRKPHSNDRLATTWKIIRIVSEMGGLGYFFYSNFPGKGVDVQIAVGSLCGSFLVTYGAATLINARHRPFAESSMMNHLFFRTIVSPGLGGGIDPIFFYIYTVNYPILVGSHHLNDLSVQKALLEAFTWAIYGGRAALDMVVFESNRYKLYPSLSRYLLLSNLITAMDMMRGII